MSYMTAVRRRKRARREKILVANKEGRGEKRTAKQQKLLMNHSCDRQGYTSHQGTPTAPTTCKDDRLTIRKQYTKVCWRSEVRGGGSGRKATAGARSCTAKTRSTRHQKLSGRRLHHFRPLQIIGQTASDDLRQVQAQAIERKTTLGSVLNIEMAGSCSAEENKSKQVSSRAGPGQVPSEVRGPLSLLY